MAGRKISTEFPEQPQKTPGLEHKMRPEPEVIRPDYKGSDKLLGKAALITGGDSGIGRAVAVHFAREGADVAIVYLEEENSDAEKTRAMVEKEGRRCLLLPGDVPDKEFCAFAVKKTREELGGLNILVNNAAEQHPVDDIRKLRLCDHGEDVPDQHFRHVLPVQGSAEEICGRETASSTPRASPITGDTRSSSITPPPRGRSLLSRGRWARTWPRTGFE